MSNYCNTFNFHSFTWVDHIRPGIYVWNESCPGRLYVLPCGIYLKLENFTPVVGELIEGRILAFIVCEGCKEPWYMY